MSGYQSDDSTSGPRVPRGVLQTTRKGWKGEELELEHHKEASGRDHSSSAAVDLNQFRNTEVGKGYQAKHVVRQSTGRSSDVTIKDMTKVSSDADKRETSSAPDKKKRKRGKSDKRNDRTSLGEKRLQKYLECEGLRAFRKELEKFD